MRLPKLFSKSSIGIFALVVAVAVFAACTDGANAALSSSTIAAVFFIAIMPLQSPR